MIHTTVLGVPQVIIHEHGSPVRAFPNIDIYALIRSTRCQSTSPLSLLCESPSSSDNVFIMVRNQNVGHGAGPGEEASIPELRNGRERRWLRGG
jgi:hypothetical protein